MVLVDFERAAQEVSNFPGFDILDSWEFLRQEINVQGMEGKVIFCKRPLNGILDSKFFEAGEAVTAILGSQNDAVLLVPVMKGDEFHMVALGFRASTDEVQYMDSTGERFKQDYVDNLKKILAGAELTGKIKLRTEIPVQQDETQPNTCVLWALRNVGDFLNNKPIFAANTREEACTAIAPSVLDASKFQRGRDNCRIGKVMP
jgi:hypothetical protein